jgi:hypothetical protein
MHSEGLTRRGVLTIACGAATARLYGFGPDFWNKKDPSEWSSQEIDQLTSKSPWAKEVSASAPGEYGNGGSRSSSPRVGGSIPGIGGIGGGGGGGGRRNGGGGAPPVQSHSGTVRWESAQPILDAMKSKVPEAFSNHYVISVSGFPLNGGRRRSQSEDDDPNADVERLKGVTYLEVKGKRDLQPGVVQQQMSSYGNVLFGFSKEMLALKVDDKEVAFATQFGRMNVKAKFNLKDMLYHGELAV